LPIFILQRSILPGALTPLRVILVASIFKLFSLAFLLVDSSSLPLARASGMLETVAEARTPFPAYLGTCPSPALFLSTNFLHTLPPPLPLKTYPFLSFPRPPLLRWNDPISNSSSEIARGRIPAHLLAADGASRR